MRALRPALAATFALAVTDAAAHPHVWIVGRAGYRLEAGRVVAVEVSLRFDELSSAFLAGEFDRDRNGRFDPDETRRIEREAFAGLAELDWLSRLGVGGLPVRLQQPTAFRAELEAGMVTYQFERRLATPLDPRTGPLALTLVDPSWYVDIVLDANEPARLVGDVPAGCELVFEPDTGIDGLAAPMPPIAAILSCGRSS